MPVLTSRNLGNSSQTSSPKVKEDFGRIDYMEVSDRKQIIQAGKKTDPMYESSVKQDSEVLDDVDAPNALCSPQGMKDQTMPAMHPGYLHPDLSVKTTVHGINITPDMSYPRQLLSDEAELDALQSKSISRMRSGKDYSFFLAGGSSKFPHVNTFQK